MIYIPHLCTFINKHVPKHCHPKPSKLHPAPTGSILTNSELEVLWPTDILPARLQVTKPSHTCPCFRWCVCSCSPARALSTIREIDPREKQPNERVVFQPEPFPVGHVMQSHERSCAWRRDVNSRGRHCSSRLPGITTTARQNRTAVSSPRPLALHICQQDDSNLI